MTSKHNNFRLDEERVRNAFADFVPVPDQDQWNKIEQSLEHIGVQRRNSLRQKLHRTLVFSGLILLGASLVAFINITKHQTKSNEKALNTNEEMAVGDHFFYSSDSLFMKRVVTELKHQKIIVADSTNSIQIDSLKSLEIASGRLKEVISTDSSAEVKRQATPSEPKKKKKRKKRKRKPASHNPSDDEVIIN